MIWESLPYPNGVNFTKLYMDFIYDGLMKLDVNESTFRFINLFYLTSPISDEKYTQIEFKIEHLKNILSAIEKVVNKNKENDYGAIFFNNQDEEQDIICISEFIAVVYALKVAEDKVDDLKEYIDRIMQTMKIKGVSGSAIDAVQFAISGDYLNATNILKPAFWSNNKKAMAEAAIGFQLILFVAKKKNQDISLIKDSVLDVMEKLQYSDIKYVKTTWNLLRRLILITLSDDEKIQEKIAEIYRNCMNSYSFNGLKGNKYYFEAMYNCNKTLKKHIEKIQSQGITVGEALNSVVEYIKSLRIPELSSEWD